MSTEPADQLYPVLPLRDIVVFPGMTMPLFVGRPRSFRAVEHALAGRQDLLLIAQKAGATEDPGQADLYGVGTIARIVEHVTTPSGAMKLLVKGTGRARLGRVAVSEPFLAAAIEPLGDPVGEPGKVQPLSDEIEEIAARARRFVEQLEAADSGAVAETVAQRSPASDLAVARMQALLEADFPTLEERLQALADLSGR